MIITNHPAQRLLNQSQKKKKSVNKVGNCRHYSPFSLVYVCVRLLVHVYVQVCIFCQVLTGVVRFLGVCSWWSTQKKRLVIEEIALKSLSLECLTSCNHSLTCE